MEKVYAGARLRRLRQERGFSQVALARMLAISPSYLNQIEHDTRPLTVGVLVRLTEVIGVDAAFFSARDTARRLAELRELMPEVGVATLADLAEQQPQVGDAVIALGRRLRETTDRLATISDGRTGLASLGAHEAVRDFFYERQNHLGAVDRAAEAQAREIGTRRREVRLRLREHLENRHGVRVLSNRDVTEAEDALHHFDADARTLTLSPHLRGGQQAFRMATELAILEHGELLDAAVAEHTWADDRTRRLARLAVAHHFAGAFILPYVPFHTAAEKFRYDVDLLATHFGVSWETVAHRLSTLQRPERRGVPFIFMRVDRAGNVSKRQSATDFHFSRAGGTCPLWNVYESFAAPGRVVRQVAEMPDGRRHLWIARSITRQNGGYGRPGKTFAIGLGCELRHAGRLVYGDGIAVHGAPAMPIGPGCKSCVRTDCPQRAAPQSGADLEVAEHRSTFVPYTLAGQ